MDRSGLSPPVNGSDRRPERGSPPRKRVKINGADTVGGDDGPCVSFPAILPHATTPIPSNEVIRLMIQAMEELGMKQSAQSLREESSLLEEDPAIQRIKQLILLGQWESVIDSLTLIQCTTPLRALLVSWSVQRHRYLELLEEQRIPDALLVLNNHLRPLSENITEIYKEEDEKDDDTDTEHPDYLLLLRRLSSYVPSALHRLYG